MNKLLVQLTEQELKNLVTEASREAISEALKHIQPVEEEPGKPEAKLLTKRQAATVLNCSQSTVDNLRRAGKLNTVRVRNKVCFTVEEIHNLAKPK